jgi:hypothetical protein
MLVGRMGVGSASPCRTGYFIREMFAGKPPDGPTSDGSERRLFEAR